MVNQRRLENRAKLARKWCLVSTTAAASGHPTTCLSAADLMTVLFDKYFSYDLKNPQNLNNDRIIFSKGHGAPLLYTLFALSGAFPVGHLKTLRKIDSDLEGHPTPNFKYYEAATGSLGQGLSIGAGEALAIRVQSSKFKVQSLPKVYVLLGDGEMAEGSIWEGANFASHYKLDNLIAVLDVNRLGQSGETMFGHALKEYEKRFTAFGWKTIIINGHNFKEIINAYKRAISNKSGKPFIIIAKTKKGKGVSFLEDKDGWHGKPLKKEDLEAALKEIGNVDENLRFSLRIPAPYRAEAARKNTADSPRYTLGDEIATREAYGEVLAQLASEDKNIYALDADVKNSTYSEKLKKTSPERFIECFIAEQNMAGVATGFANLGLKPFVSTFAAFLTRAFDQIRMSAIGKANIVFVGSHAGVSIGEDGPSQMGLEDMAMFGVIPDSIIFHPCDAVSTAKIISLLNSYKGISYLRTLRPKTPVIYSGNEDFSIGGSKILRQSKNDLLTIASCGIIVIEALKAYEELKKEKINIRIVDCYCVKPIDRETLLKCAKETKQKIIITVEDHFKHGGLGDFILDSLSSSKIIVEKMAVKTISRSGTKDELLDMAGISAKHIIRKVKNLI